MAKPAFPVLLLLLFSGLVHSRFVAEPYSDLISDGIRHGRQSSSVLLHRSPETSSSSSSSETCEQTYGFLPCTTTIIGNLFLIVVYGYLMFLGATYLSNGCELLLQILGPGIIGGLFLPILGAFPDAMLILVSGLSGSKETAQEQVLIGMGLLAGSTVMLLTLLWGSCVIVGKCNLSEGSTAIDSQDTKGCSLTGFFLNPRFHYQEGFVYTDHIRSGVTKVIERLAPDVTFVIEATREVTLISFNTVPIRRLTIEQTLDRLVCEAVPDWKMSLNDFRDDEGSGVTTDELTRYAARIMVISVIPFIIVQIPLIFNLSSGRRVAVLVGLIVSIVSLLLYCFYQIYQPWIQKRRLAYAKHKHVISGILNYAQKVGIGKLFRDDGEPDEEKIKKLFDRIDTNMDGSISREELKALIVGIKFNEIDLDKEDAVNRVMADFDTSGNSLIDQGEFIEGISKWLIRVKHSIPNRSYSIKVPDYYQKTKEEHDMLLEKSDETVEEIVDSSWTCFKAVMLLLLGTVIAAVFADPLVDAVDNFSSATSIPSFFISFIAMPLATNSSEAVSAIIFASRKKKRTASLTFSEIYGAVTMNNLLCLAVFLAIVYVRHLTWDFSAEVLVIVIVVIVMGLFASFRATFQVWTSIIAFLLYPLSLVLVYVLDYVFGWS